MRRKLLIIWYGLLIFSVIELVAYGLTAYVPNHYRHMVLEGFNKDVQSFHDIDKGIPYAESINRYGNHAGVNPQIIMSIIQAESSFQPRAVSNAGAYGLMQIMPETWRQINKSAKVCVLRHQGECNIECYYNADLNIQIGIHYLNQLLRKYQGNMIFALAAYNAGPGAVDHYGGIPPYVETVKYTETIIENYYNIKKEKTPYPSVFVTQAWDKAHRVIGWCLILTAMAMVWIMSRLVKFQSSWRWR